MKPTIAAAPGNVRSARIQWVPGRVPVELVFVAVKAVTSDVLVFPLRSHGVPTIAPRARVVAQRAGVPPMNGERRRVLHTSTATANSTSIADRPVANAITAGC